MNQRTFVLLVLGLGALLCALGIAEVAKGLERQARARREQAILRAMTESLEDENVRRAHPDRGEDGGTGCER